MRQGLKAYSNWPTYPQLYAAGTLLGGLDIIKVTPTPLQCTVNPNPNATAMQELDAEDELLDALGCE